VDGESKLALQRSFKSSFDQRLIARPARLVVKLVQARASIDFIVLILMLCKSISESTSFGAYGFTVW